MPSSNLPWILVGLAVVVVLVLMCHKHHSHEKMTFKQAAGFSPSIPIPYFEGMPPSLAVENRYHELIQQDCGGNYNDYKCRQRVYYKAMKDGTYDKADLICWSKRDDADAYYDCLDGIYGNFLGPTMDRFPGPGNNCIGANGIKGASGQPGDYCFSPVQRPMEDRRPMDGMGNVIDRLPGTA